MNHPIESVKMAEVAEPRMKINLQQFAGETDTANTSTETETQTETDSNTQTETGENDTSDVADQKQGRDFEKDSAFADMRRKAESAEAKAKEVERQLQTDREISKKYGAEYGVFSEADIAEKYGQSHNIRTKEQFEQAVLYDQARQKGIDPNEINRLIENHPDVKTAKELQEKERQRQTDEHLNQQFNELKSEHTDLGLNKLEDLFDLPFYNKMHEKIIRGYSILDAYESVNKAEIKKKAAEQGKQAALNAVNGKSHIKGSGDGDADVETVRVPDDVLANYRRMFARELREGKMTEADFAKHYKKSIGK